MAGQGMGASGRDARAPLVATVVLVGTWTAYFVALHLLPWVGLERVLKGLLMPTLLLWVLAAAGPARTPRWLVGGLVFATVGDIAIDIDFIAGMLGFLVMQLCYIAGFVHAGALRRIRERWWPVVAYAAIWLAANLALGPQLGELRLPVAVYSLAICVMAALATGLHRRVGIGAALFVVSDALIAAGEAGIDLPLRSALVMPTYLAAQWCIATGWLAHAASDRDPAADVTHPSPAAGLST
jgi:uncharacterized membrane protein YhhN